MLESIDWLVEIIQVNNICIRNRILLKLGHGEETKAVNLTLLTLA